MKATPKLRVFLFCGWVLLCAALLICNRPPTTAQAQSAQETERERLLAIGKELFVARCASCHNERGDKPLSSGVPLSQRKLSREAIERAANGRLSKESAERRRGVALYIESILVKEPR